MGEKEVVTDDQMIAKQQLRVKLNETKMLGLPWNKDEDTSAVEIASEVKKLTKQRILQKLASIYDPLRMISPTTIIEKIIYRDVCDSKLSWDDEPPDWIVKKSKKWETKLPTKVKVSRSIRLSKESLNLIDIYVFGYANFLGTCVVAYAVIQQPSGIKQGLIASKSRLSKKQMTIPRL